MTPAGKSAAAAPAAPAPAAPAMAAAPAVRRPRRMGLRKRLMLIFAVGAFVVSAGVAVISYERSRAYLVNQRQTSLEQQTFTNARLVRNRIREGEPDLVALLASLGPRSSSSHFLVRNGQWTGRAPESGAAIVPPGLRAAVLEGHAGKQLFRSGGTPMLAVGVPIAENGSTYFAVYALLQLDRTLNVLGNSLIVAAVITTLAGAAAGRWASRRVLDPLAEVSEAAAAVAGGRLDVRLETGLDPDLATVATAFNRMTDALQARIERDARFASAVSHELRSPLATLVASVEVVSARRDELVGPAREAVDLLVDEVAHLRRLVEDLLEISRLEAGVADVALEDVRVGEFLQQAIRGTPIRLADGAGAAVVRADKRRLERVVGNLITNAERHAGGAAAVAVERVDDRVRIAVEDHGPGVPPDEREQIFERFVRGKAARQRHPGGGAGLGLSLVAEHVRVHDGRVWVEDRPGGGARFVVELPVVG